MRILFCQGGERWKIDDCGKAYTSGSFDERIWERYKLYGSELTVMFAEERKRYNSGLLPTKYNFFDETKYNRISLVDEINPKVNTFNILIKKRNRDIIYKAVKDADVIIIRSLGTFVTNSTFKIANKLNKPIITEVTGPIFEGNYYGGFFSRMLAVSREWSAKKLNSVAKYTLFRLLSVPLSLEEENRLENSLLREGCREPIVVWHGCILDGHKRYEICSYEEMDYKTVEMNFVSREDAIIWICKKRVKESSADKTIYKYLVGKWYNAEKTRIHAKRKEERRKSLDLAIKKKGEEGQLVSIPVDRISKVIAVQISMSYNSVESYGMLAKFLDEIAEKDEAFFTALVENKIVVSFEKMRKFAQMDETKLIDIRRKLLREEDVKMRQRKPRQQSTDGLSGKTQQKQTTPLEVGIKEMPMFDPDMEFRGLALTIPTWMNAIARTRAKTDIDLVSEPTKAQLAVILRRLEEQITQTLEVIER